MGKSRKKEKEIIEAWDIEPGDVVNVSPSQVQILRGKEPDQRLVPLDRDLVRDCPIGQEVVDCWNVEIKVVECSEVLVDGVPHTKIRHHRLGGYVFLRYDEVVEVTEVREFRKPKVRPIPARR